MLIIRDSQREVFKKAALQNFQKGMLVHIRDHFPRHVKVFGEEAILNVIRHGCERAGKQGLKTQHELCLYIDLMVMLGSGFDTDPQLPWAAEILGDESAAKLGDRIERIYSRAMDYLDRVVGPEEVFPIPVYRRVQQLSWGEVHAQFRGELSQSANNLFSLLWPEKCRQIGLEGVQTLLSHAQTVANVRGITELPYVGVYAGFMFVLGHEFDRDPLYPVISQILEGDEARRNPQKGLHRLFGEILTLLAREIR